MGRYLKQTCYGIIYMLTCPGSGVVASGAMVASFA
jgi:hypothetical protein